MYEPYSHLPAQNPADQLPLGARYHSADPIRWHGSLVYPMYSEQFGPAPTTLTMYTISAAPPAGLRGHGIGLSVTDGYLGIEGRQLGGVDVWSDVLSGGVTFDLTPTSPQAMFTLTPVWVDENGTQKSFMGNYGIVIETSPDGRMVLWCSVGEGPPNFANLVIGLDTSVTAGPRTWFAAEPSPEPSGKPGAQVAGSAAPIPVSQQWFETAGEIIAEAEPESFAPAPVAAQPPAAQPGAAQPLATPPVAAPPPAPQPLAPQPVAPQPLTPQPVAAQPVAPAIGSPEWFAANGLTDPRTTPAGAYAADPARRTEERATPVQRMPALTGDQTWYADHPGNSASVAAQRDRSAAPTAAEPEPFAGYGMPVHPPSRPAEPGPPPIATPNGFGADWQSRFGPDQFSDRAQPGWQPEPQKHPGEPAPVTTNRDWFGNERPVQTPAGNAGSGQPQAPSPQADFGRTDPAPRRPVSERLPDPSISWPTAPPAVAEPRDRFSPSEVAQSASTSGDWSPAAQPKAYESAPAWATEEIPGHTGDTEWQAGARRDKDPDTSMRGALYDLGVAMYSRGEEDQACGLWAQAAEAGHAAAAYDLGVVRFRRGDVNDAERWWRTAAERREPRAMAGLAELLDRQGNYAEARRWRASAAEDIDQSV
ncbi:tetratricopeptide repeat protein [Nocardia goodfellowii]|uniref:Tetratricopeptide repeat protein n=1 Tax=Nocardia goodfellowii TaxID=882446 RepID=A0ABS4QJ14_9NOCA|nr:tetratricopeptide repeat protein [Nocardia goodfellowii]MBP2191704.1 hypothetical protein [Nocardia goodfellowii]